MRVDGWARHTRLERDLTIVGAAVVGAASLIGGVLGWVGRQLFEHLHHAGRSDHFR